MIVFLLGLPAYNIVDSKQLPARKLRDSLIRLPSPRSQHIRFDTSGTGGVDGLVEGDIAIPQVTRGVGDDENHTLTIGSPGIMDAGTPF